MQCQMRWLPCSADPTSLETAEPSCGVRFRNRCGEEREQKDFFSDSEESHDLEMDAAQQGNEVLVEPRKGPTLLSRCLHHHSSVLQWVQRIKWARQRNFYEARALAQAIDAFYSTGISAKHEGMEILLCRLFGIQLKRTQQATPSGGNGAPPTTARCSQEHDAHRTQKC